MNDTDDKYPETMHGFIWGIKDPEPIQTNSPGPPDPPDHDSHAMDILIGTFEGLAQRNGHRADLGKIRMQRKDFLTFDIQSYNRHMLRMYITNCKHCNVEMTVTMSCEIPTHVVNMGINDKTICKRLRSFK